MLRPPTRNVLHQFSNNVGLPGNNELGFHSGFFMCSKFKQYQIVMKQHRWKSMDEIPLLSFTRFVLQQFEKTEAGKKGGEPERTWRWNHLLERSARRPKGASGESDLEAGACWILGITWCIVGCVVLIMVVLVVVFQNRNIGILEFQDGSVFWKAKDVLNQLLQYAHSCSTSSPGSPSQHEAGAKVR